MKITKEKKQIIRLLLIVLGVIASPFIFLGIICLIWLAAVYIDAYMNPYENKYTITDISLQRVELDDSIYSGQKLYLLNFECETSEYEYRIGCFPPYMGGCSDTLNEIKIFDSTKRNVLYNFQKVDTFYIEKTWELEKDTSQTYSALSVSPSDFLTVLAGDYRFSEASNEYREGFPILIRLDCDTIVPDVIELHSNVRVIRAKVNNTPQKMKVIKYEPEHFRSYRRFTTSQYYLVDSSLTYGPDDSRCYEYYYSTIPNDKW